MLVLNLFLRKKEKPYVFCKKSLVAQVWSHH